MRADVPMLKEVRGKGLLNAIVIDEFKERAGRRRRDGRVPGTVGQRAPGCLRTATIRLAPPLVLSEEQLGEHQHHQETLRQMA